MNTLIFLAAFKGGAACSMSGAPVCAAVFFGAGLALLGLGTWMLSKAPEVELVRVQ